MSDSEQNSNTVKVEYVEKKGFKTVQSTGVTIYDSPNIPQTIELCFFADRLQLNNEEFSKTVLNDSEVEMRPTGNVDITPVREKLIALQMHESTLRKFAKQLNEVIDQMDKNDGNGNRQQ